MNNQVPKLAIAELSILDGDNQEHDEKLLMETCKVYGIDLCNGMEDSLFKYPADRVSDFLKSLISTFGDFTCRVYGDYDDADSEDHRIETQKDTMDNEDDVLNDLGDQIDEIEDNFSPA